MLHLILSWLAAPQAYLAPASDSEGDSAGDADTRGSNGEDDAERYRQLLLSEGGATAAAQQRRGGKAWAGGGGGEGGDGGEEEDQEGEDEDAQGVAGASGRKADDRGVDMEVRHGHRVRCGRAMTAPLRAPAGARPGKATDCRGGSAGDVHAGPGGPGRAAGVPQEGRGRAQGGDRLAGLPAAQGRAEGSRARARPPQRQQRL